jgi:hypothetical protein
MKRLFALALVASLGLPSIAFAEGPIAQSASKSIRETTTSSATPAVKLEEASIGFPSYAAKAGVRPATALAQQGGAGTVSQTGMKRSTKVLIFAAAAAAFAGSAYGIDHKVKDVTPSSLGTRNDNSVFNK